MITIVDYGLGNIGSIRNMLRKVGVDSELAADAKAISAARKLILPGVGAFDAAMARLRGSDLEGVLTERVVCGGVPVMGICLGMHLMTGSSAEGTVPGLAWLDAETVRFQPEPGSAMKVPHMGWNEVAVSKPSSLLANNRTGDRFYFVHSYFVRCRNAADVLLTTHYGGAFAAAIECKNIVAVQFHPEKSHRFGLALLGAFAAWNPT